jgi:hypothetical protein
MSPKLLITISTWMKMPIPWAAMRRRCKND